MKPLDVSMCWDGQTPAAELTVNGVTVIGEPDEVRRIFDALNDLNSWAITTAPKLRQLGIELERISLALDRLGSEVEP